MPSPPALEVCLPPLDELARRWPEIEVHLRRATARTESYEPIDLLRLTMAGEWGIWTVEQGGTIIAAAAGRIHQHPRNRILEVPFIGGNGLMLWAKPLLAALDDHARKAGCAAIQGFDRKGWARFGFAIDGVVLTRHL